jgi:hypothetical protein
MARGANGDRRYWRRLLGLKALAMAPESADNDVAAKAERGGNLPRRFAAGNERQHGREARRVLDLRHGEESARFHR